MPTAPAPPPLTAETTMAEVLKAYPGAQRALFARYHIGGCSICAFSPGETLAQLCARNEGILVAEVIQHIQDSQVGDASLQITPEEFAQLRRDGVHMRILDVRTREEHEAVRLPDAQLMTQDVVQEIFTSGSREALLVLYDHTGQRALDAVAYFIGHGFANAKCLAGGIDAYSREIDLSLPRYRLELES